MADEMTVEAQALSQPKCYFGTSDKFKFTLPDGVSWIEHKKLNEGERKRYQDSSTMTQTGRPGGDEVTIKVRMGTERHILLEMAITDFYLFDENGNQVPYNDRSKKDYLDKLDPDIIDALEADIREHNKWLLGMATIEAVENEILRLEEQKRYLMEREAKN